MSLISICAFQLEFLERQIEWWWIVSAFVFLGKLKLFLFDSWRIIFPDTVYLLAFFSFNIGISNSTLAWSAEFQWQLNWDSFVGYNIFPQVPFRTLFHLKFWQFRYNMFWTSSLCIGIIGCSIYFPSWVSSFQKTGDIFYSLLFWWNPTGHVSFMMFSLFSSN